MRLNGLASISDNQAESLSRHGGELSLDGLISLNDNQAESLSKQEGELSLKGLISITENQARILAKHEKMVYCEQDDVRKLIEKYKYYGYK